MILLATFGAALLGAWIGGRSKHLSEHLGEPLGVLQGALLGVVGLILAFGLSLALSRYEDRRTAVVDEANAIGSVYMDSRLLPGGQRAAASVLIDRYAEQATHIGDRVPGSAGEDAAIANEERLQDQLWAVATRAVHASPQATGPDQYAQSVSDLADAQVVRQAALVNRVPQAVLWLEILGAAVALMLLAGYVAMIGRGERAVLIVSALVAFLLFVIAELDRPVEGLIKVPDAPLTEQYQSMHSHG